MNVSGQKNLFSIKVFTTHTRKIPRQEKNGHCCNPECRRHHHPSPKWSERELQLHSWHGLKDVVALSCMACVISEVGNSNSNISNTSRTGSLLTKAVLFQTIQFGGRSTVVLYFWEGYNFFCLDFYFRTLNNLLCTSILKARKQNSKKKVKKETTKCTKNLKYANTP